MRLTTMRRTFHSIPIAFFVITILSLIIWASTRDQAGVIRPQAPRVGRVLLKKLLEHDHHFVPANDASFRYFGRWIPTTNQLRRDVSFPGAYIEFDIANTTSLYIKLRNIREDRSPVESPTKIDARQLFVQHGRDNTPPSGAVSLLVQIDQGQLLYFNRTGHDVLAISSSLDVTNSHTITLTNLEAVRSGSILEFEGIWLDQGGHFSRDSGNAATRKFLGHQPVRSTIDSPTPKHFEVVTSHAYDDPSTAINAWPWSLARHVNTSYTVFPTTDNCLTHTCSLSEVPLSDLYFRSGPPGTSHFQLPYRFGSSPPAALILDIGLLDYQNFLSGSPSSHAINHFTTTLVKQYTSFVSTIRSTAYPYHSPYLTQQRGTLAVDASFTYNSAPSTLPIFLLTPFTPSKRLHRLLSHAVSETVNTLQAQGDKSTFWIDTSGWLAKQDFIDFSDSTEREQSSFSNRQPESYTSIPTLRSQAHRKIATHLAHHLCPYLSSAPAFSPEANTTATSLSPLAGDTAQNPCPFNKYDNYLGHLYVPIEADMSKMLEERKIELVKRFLGMEQVLG